MNPCIDCKYRAGADLCSLGYKQPIQEECPDHQRFERESQDPVQDAINNLEVHGTEEFHKIPRVVRGFYPNRYLISCWNRVAIFKVPSNEDHKTRIVDKERVLKRARALHVRLIHGNQGHDLILVTQQRQPYHTDPIRELAATFRLRRQQ